MTSALTPITATTSGLPGLVGMLDRARALLDTASTLSDMRDAQAVIDVAIAAARTLHGRQSPLTTEDQFQQVRDQMAEALILKHEALCRLAREIDAARARGDLAGHGGAARFAASGPSKQTGAPLGRTDTSETSADTPGPKVTDRHLGLGGDDQPKWTDAPLAGSSPASLADVGIGQRQASRAAARLRAEADAPGAYAAAAKQIAGRDRTLPSDAAVRSTIANRMAVLDAPDIAAPRRRRAKSAPVDGTESHRRKLLGAATALARALDHPQTPFAVKKMDAAQLTDLTALIDTIRIKTRPAIVAGTDHTDAKQDIS